jgi:hypothetical protein
MVDMNAAPNARGSPNARALLEADHTRLDAMLELVARSVREDALEDAKARWNELDVALLAHLDAEEMFVIPAMMALDASAAREIVAEHGEIRCSLGDIGIGFDLHMVRADAIDAFCTRLRAHAAHEEVMYGRIVSELPSSSARALVARLRAHTSAPADSKRPIHAAR